MLEVDTCNYGEPSLFTRLIWRFKAWRKRNEPSSTERHALREFKAAGYPPIAECGDGPDKWIQENVIELLRVFSEQGHSGSSAPYCIRMFEKLANFEPLVPLTGADDEWNEVSGGVWQNNRCSHVFKEADGRAYDMDGRIFRQPDGCCFTNRDSRVYITFPYTPTREYVDVTG